MKPKRPISQVFTGLVILGLIGSIIFVTAHFRNQTEVQLADETASTASSQAADDSVESSVASQTRSPGTATNAGGSGLSNSPSRVGMFSPLVVQRGRILGGRYGTMTIEEIIRELTETPGGTEIQQIFQALAIRKEESLPIIKQRLVDGEMWEKYALGKFLGLVRWSETAPELAALARNETEHWLPRQTALYTLGSIGDPAIGEDALSILESPGIPKALALASISALARTGYAEATDVISTFSKSDDVHIRLFANRALAEFGKPVESEFLISALESDDYVVRQEAAGALWAVPRNDVSSRLQTLATTDLHEAVRDAAAQSLILRDLMGRTVPERVHILRQALENAERLTMLWILQMLLRDGQEEGQSLVETLAWQDDALGERARAYLLFSRSRL